jgi:hypothetical protein
LNGTNSKFRYITDNADNLVMTASQAKNDLGLVLGSDGKYTFSQKYSNDADGFAAFMTDHGVTQKDGKYDTNSTNYQYYADIYAKLNEKTTTTDTNGVTTTASTPKVTVLTESQASDPKWLERQIASGGVFLNEFNANDNKFQGVSWTSGDNTMNEQTDSFDTARAEAKYEAVMADINSKDKRFDAELKTIDTEHLAIQTEIDSVKKVIDKNIERSFKIFQA